MLLAKQELLAALAAELDRLSPGSGSKASFESPKVAAHGDLACTAAMQLAKPLKQDPRQLAEPQRAVEPRRLEEPHPLVAPRRPVEARRVAARLAEERPGLAGRA